MKMGIKKILWQKDLLIDGQMYDVLIPLPTNADACLQDLGIDDFWHDNTDLDKWYEDFLKILKHFMDESKVHIQINDPFEMEKRKKSLLGRLLYSFSFEKMKKATPENFSEIPFFLSQVDDLRLHIKMNDREIILSYGHEIFWMRGFVPSEIENLGYPLLKINHPELARFF